MSKKLGITGLILAVIAIVLSAAALVNATKSVSQGKQDEGDVQYVLYLGTNDKDTNEPVFTAEEAKTEAEKILLEHFGGYTIQEANGGWIDNDTVYQEYTLVIYLSDTALDQVHDAADEMIDVFHQSSVLIQENKTVTDFYSGREG